MTTGPVVNLHLGSPERGDISRRGSTAKRIGTRSSTTAVKALQLLQPAKGANEGCRNGSGHFAKHNKAPRRGTVINTVVTNSLVIPPEITEWLNKSEWKQIKSLLGKTQPALYYAWGEDYNNNPKKVGQLDPSRMLDLERVKSCGLKKMYLVACNCDASLYSFTGSPVRLHGRLWYFQLTLKPIHHIHISIANVVVANILCLLMSAQLMMPFLVATTRETATVVMKTTMAMTTWTMVPKIPFPHPLQVVTPLLLLPILSNQVVTEMLLVAEMTPMSCCCHALTTLCNNVFLLLIPPQL
jgi:hypothetical protein